MKKKKQQWPRAFVEVLRVFIDAGSSNYTCCLQNAEPNAANECTIQDYMKFWYDRENNKFSKRERVWTRLPLFFCCICQCLTWSISTPPADRKWKEAEKTSYFPLDPHPTYVKEVMHSFGGKGAVFINPGTGLSSSVAVLAFSRRIF